MSNKNSNFIWFEISLFTQNCSNVYGLARERITAIDDAIDIKNVTVQLSRQSNNDHLGIVKNCTNKEMKKILGPPSWNSHSPSLQENTNVDKKDVNILEVDGHIKISTLPVHEILLGDNNIKILRLSN